MYLGDDRSSGYYDRGGEQAHQRGRFLLLLQSEDGNGGDPLRAVVRKVALRQFGHFVMGRARIAGRSFTVSGAYGSDGLPLTVPADVYALGVEVPAELHAAWNNGGGWNSCGSEAPAMREWAIKTFPKDGAR